MKTDFKMEIDSLSSQRTLNTLQYKDSIINLKNLDQTFLIKNLEKILSTKNIDKYFTEQDFKRLENFLPKSKSNSQIQIKSQIKEIIKNPSPIKSSQTILQKFRILHENNFFTKQYQKKLDYLDIQSLECYLKNMLNQYKNIKGNSFQFLQSFLNNDLEFSEGNDLLNQRISKGQVYYNYLSEAGSSGYTSLYSDEEKDELESNEIQGEKEKRSVTQKEEKQNFENMLSPERFKNMKTNKNQLTIRTRTKEEIQSYHYQEVERYKHPHLPFEYLNPDGSKAIVAPVSKKMPSTQTSKPREHAMLKQDRPSYVTILCLARDAAARLPDGVGTRADICDLLKDSQYINERLSDTQINNIVSGALDRLHYEKDPCVKYDLNRKLWIYLHKNRPLDFPGWSEHLKNSEINLQATNLSITISKKDIDMVGFKKRTSDEGIKLKDNELVSSSNGLRITLNKKDLQFENNNLFEKDTPKKFDENENMESGLDGDNISANKKKGKKDMLKKKRKKE